VAAFEEREESFGRVRVDVHAVRVQAGIFSGTVLDGAMLSGVVSDALIGWQFVRHNDGFLGDVEGDFILERVSGHVLNRKRSSAAIALD